MAIVVKCPDCGGTIGGSDNDGDYPCTCRIPEEDTPAPSQAPAGAAANASLPDDRTAEDLGTDVADAPGTPTLARQPKVCCQCGKDLTGQRRYKDSAGYWCTACHKLDRDRNKIQGEPCDDCGRIFPPEKLQPFDNHKLCIRCIRERREVQSKKRRIKVSDKHYKEEEKRRLVLLLLVFGFLLTLAILAYFGVIGEK
jgi:hypothetical protein